LLTRSRRTVGSPEPADAFPPAGAPFPLPRSKVNSSSSPLWARLVCRLVDLPTGNL